MSAVSAADRSGSLKLRVQLLLLLLFVRIFERISKTSHLLVVLKDQNRVISAGEHLRVQTVELLHNALGRRLVDPGICGIVSLLFEPFAFRLLVLQCVVVEKHEAPAGMGFHIIPVPVVEPVPEVGWIVRLAAPGLPVVIPERKDLDVPVREHCVDTGVRSYPCNAPKNRGGILSST